MVAAKGSNEAESLMGSLELVSGEVRDSSRRESRSVSVSWASFGSPVPPIESGQRDEVPLPGVLGVCPPIP